MTTLLADVRYALRRLAATPMFTFAVVLTLALGLGVNTAMFTALEAMAFRRLPYPDADRLVFVWGHRPASPTPLLPVSLPVALTVGERARSLDRVEAWTSLPDTRFSLTDGGNPIDVQYAVVSSGLLSMLGAQPVRGRGFTAADDRMGAPRVAMISGRLWQDRFAAADEVVGRPISLDGDAIPSSASFRLASASWIILERLTSGCRLAPTHFGRVDSRLWPRWGSWLTSLLSRPSTRRAPSSAASRPPSAVTFHRFATGR